MSRQTGGPAFPITAQQDPNGGMLTWNSDGITVRDYFAAHAPFTLEDARNYWKRTATDYGGHWPDMSVLLAVLAKLRGEYADTMLAERAP